LELRQPDESKHKESSSFLRKGTKKLLIVQVAPVESAALTKTTKVFCFFFQKRNTSLLP
jgi:hypothetical protein